MDTQFTDLSEPDPNIQYYYSKYQMCEGFTYLMKLVLMAGVKMRQSLDVIPLIKTLAKDKVDERNKEGYTALILSCRNSNNGSSIEIVKILIDAGADVNIEVRDITHLLMSIPNVRTTQMLIGAGSDVNIKNKNNQTFLMLLLIQGFLDNYYEIIIQLLYISGETLLDTDVQGKNAYDYYIEKGYNILDEYHLKILIGEISPNNTKSARFC